MTEFKRPRKAGALRSALIRALGGYAIHGDAVCFLRDDGPVFTPPIKLESLHLSVVPVTVEAELLPGTETHAAEGMLAEQLGALLLEGQLISFVPRQEGARRILRANIDVVSSHGPLKVDAVVRTDEGVLE